MSCGRLQYDVFYCKLLLYFLFTILLGTPAPSSRAIVPTLLNLIGGLSGEKTKLDERKGNQGDYPGTICVYGAAVTHDCTGRF